MIVPENISRSLSRVSSHRTQATCETNIYKDEFIVAETLFFYVPKELFPKDKLNEIAYSQLLRRLVFLFDQIIISQGGSRRDCELYLRNITPYLHLSSLNVK